MTFAAAWSSTLPRHSVSPPHRFMHIRPSQPLRTICRHGYKLALAIRLIRSMPWVGMLGEFPCLARGLAAAFGNDPSTALRVRLVVIQSPLCGR